MARSIKRFTSPEKRAARARLAASWYATDLPVEVCLGILDPLTAAMWAAGDYAGVQNHCVCLAVGAWNANLKERHVAALSMQYHAQARRRA